jgi:hypothetical protein
MSHLFCKKTLLSKDLFNSQILYKLYSVCKDLLLGLLLTKWIIDGLFLAVPRVDD